MYVVLSCVFFSKECDFGVLVFVVSSNLLVFFVFSFCLSVCECLRISWFVFCVVFDALISISLLMCVLIFAWFGKVMVV